jgi:hypothetical protein
VFGTELGHVEPDVSALVTKQQARDGLGELSFSHACRPSQESHATRSIASLATNARDGPLHQVEHVRDC